MTVPGTIASYYQEATVAFVLSSQLDYLIDPRTPLFQGDVSEPRASHLTLAEWHGPSVHSAVSSGSGTLSPAFYSPAVVQELVTEIIERQRTYASHAPVVRKKLDRYAALLAEAMQQQGEPAPTTNAKQPYVVLSPYFAVSGTSDPWWTVMQEVWKAAAALPQPGDIIPVLCLDGRPKENADGVATLAETLPLLPSTLSTVAFFWITDFDERKVSESQLRSLWNVIADRPAGRKLVNLYGGFFSICMRHAGLRGFGNGLTYSESRAWPALASTGAAPPRYYVRDLHVFMSPAVAAVLESVDPSFACPCGACVDWRATGQSIASLPYHELKRHFALARNWELDVTAVTLPANIADQLESARDRAMAAIEGNLVLGSLPSLEYLTRWAAVLRSP
ncbi:hypothetical protein [Arthrobacter woluwensis]|uniref:hypothetical protein n=1 Tax=Arthrobacter woluwensis TaxID=156980 RepID=UPI001AAEAC10|nr:hypothetical protein [Arthrobacter woluwensis]QTF71145.1 hypothetical protein G8758_03345 [Arthrobacter woluwensis]